MSSLGILLCGVLIVAVWLTLSTAMVVIAPYIAALIVIGILILALVNWDDKDKGP